MNVTECDVTAMLAESRKACKRIRKLGMLGKTIATHRLKELRYLRAVEKLAAWRKSDGFDRCDVRDGHWIHNSLPPTPGETAASMWADVNALKKVISMSKKEQRYENVQNELEGCTDEELETFERMIMERRGGAAAHEVAAQIDTAQPCNPPRSSCSEISLDVHVYMEGNTQGRMDPKRGQLESSSAGTGRLESPSARTCFETTRQQCLPNWEMSRTTVDGCLLVDVSSNLG